MFCWVTQCWFRRGWLLKDLCRVDQDCHLIAQLKTLFPEKVPPSPPFLGPPVLCSWSVNRCISLCFVFLFCRISTGGPCAQTL